MSDHARLIVVGFGLPLPAPPAQAEAGSECR